MKNNYELWKYQKTLKWYIENPNRYMGACKISGEISIPEKFHGHNFYGVHKILQELQDEGYLKQSKGKGFKKSKKQ